MADAQSAEWSAYRRDEQRRASAALADAADKSNACRVVEERLKAQGRDHTTDPGWRRAVREFDRAVVTAAGHGFDLQLIDDEACRRR